MDVEQLGVDLLSMSAHKVYGPNGIGALFIRNRPELTLEPLTTGGAQERGLRPGTVPVPLAVGFGAACRIAAQEWRSDATRIRVDWNGASNLSSLAGRPVQFRFHQRNGNLYAFWVSPSTSGASNGYLAAGGPGLSGPVDV